MWGGKKAGKEERGGFGFRGRAPVWDTCSEECWERTKQMGALSPSLSFSHTHHCCVGDCQQTPYIPLLLLLLPSKPPSTSPGTKAWGHPAWPKWSRHRQPCLNSTLLLLLLLLPPPPAGETDTKSVCVCVYELPEVVKHTLTAVHRKGPSRLSVVWQLQEQQGSVNTESNKERENQSTVPKAFAYGRQIKENILD